MVKPTGIIWIGPAYSAGGYGNVSRNYLLGLKEVGFPVKFINYGPDDRALLEPEVVYHLDELSKTEPGQYPVVIIHYIPSLYPLVKYNNIPYRIGMTIFETDRIPPEWVEPCNSMDEIWVPSEFNVETFSRAGVERSKLRIIPYSVDTDFFKPVEDRFPLKGDKGFVFLYVCMFGWRKGVDLLLRAYLEEFSRDEDVMLVLKLSYMDNKTGKTIPADKDFVLSLVSQNIDISSKSLPEFEVLGEPLTQKQLRALYNSCDLYISTDRANGWGMPCMEVMAMGKPAATIDWSGSTQFMKEHNSLLIKPTGNLIDVDPRLSGEHSIYSGHKWAEVKVDEVRRVMRFAYENRDGLLKDIAKAGMDDIRRNYNLKAVAHKVVEAIQSIDVSPNNSLMGRIRQKFGLSSYGISLP